MKYKTTRDITKNECPWLDSDIKKSSELFRFIGYTYGCISSGGTAVSVEEGTHPFFELPSDALKPADQPKADRV